MRCRVRHPAHNLNLHLALNHLPTLTLHRNLTLPGALGAESWSEPVIAPLPSRKHRTAFG